jgi:Flp pilus assembly pilin Flp
MSTLRRWMQKPVHYLRNNRAVSALEYAILVGVIAVAIAIALATFSGNITTALTTIGGKVAATKVGTIGTLN